MIYNYLLYRKTRYWFNYVGYSYKLVKSINSSYHFLSVPRNHKRFLWRL